MKIDLSWRYAEFLRYILLPFFHEKREFLALKYTNFHTDHYHTAASRLAKTVRVLYS